MLAAYRTSAVIVVGAALLQLSNGLIGVLLPLRLSAAGTSDTLIGLVASAYGGGFLIGCLRAPLLVRAGRPYPRLFGAGRDVRCHDTAFPHYRKCAAVDGASLRHRSSGLAGLFSVVEGWLAAATAALRAAG